MLYIGEGIKLRNRKIIELIAHADALVGRTQEDFRTMIQARMKISEKMGLIVSKDQTN